MPRKTRTPEGYVLVRRGEAAYRAFTRTAWGALAVVVAGSFWLPPVAAAQSDEKPADLDKLWREYPLAPPETQAPTQPDPVDEPEPATPPPPRASGDGEGSVPWPALGAGIGAALVLLTAGGVALTRRRRRPTVALTGAETPEELIALAHALAREAAECDKYVHGQRLGGMGLMTETADHDVSAPDLPSQPASGSYADIGERVAGVLAAAETAANQIREDARASAEEILSLAREEAEALRRDTDAYDADTRAAVESYASNRRREVDQELQKQLADGETQARATRQAAEAMARQIEDDARRHGQALREETRSVEERLKKAAQGLRRMTKEIDELLEAPAGEGESLTDALRPYSQRPQMPLSAVPNDEP
jgi:cell division septum initiation protein DivIVA